MIEISQEIYEKMLKKQEKLDTNQCYILAVYGMFRTVKLLERVSKDEYFSKLEAFVNFLETNSREIANNSLGDMEKLQEMIEFLEANAELVENYPESDDVMLQAILGGCYEIFEEWYNFLNLILYSYNDDDKESMVSYFTLPIRFLDNYLANLYYEQYSTKDLQKEINEHKLMLSEIARINEDIKFIEEYTHDSYMKKVEKYITTNILL